VRIEKRFEIVSPIDRVWSVLVDPYQVVNCLPGASITQRVDDRTYEGTIMVRVGPVKATYKGQARFERLDEATREMELVGRGQETSGKGSAEMRMVRRLRSVDEKTEVSVTSDVTITGVLAQFGRGMIEDVSNQMFDEFTQRLREKIESVRIYKRT